MKWELEITDTVSTCTSPTMQNLTQYDNGDIGVYMFRNGDHRHGRMSVGNDTYKSAYAKLIRFMNDMDIEANRSHEDGQDG